MDYKTKIKYAEEVANQLQNHKSIESLKSDLKTEVPYENDIANIISSAKKILGEKYQSKIKEYLINDKEIYSSEEFSLLDKEIIGNLIENETQKLAVEEKKKLTKLIKEGNPVEKALEQTDTRFLSSDKAVIHASNIQKVKKQNSVSGRMINIFGGIGLIVLTIVLLFTIHRLFYVLPIIGLIMIVKGFLTKEMEYDN